MYYRLKTESRTESQSSKTAELHGNKDREREREKKKSRAKIILVGSRVEWHVTLRERSSRDFYADATSRKHALLLAAGKGGWMKGRKRGRRENANGLALQTDEDLRERSLKEIAGKDPGTGQASNVLPWRRYPPAPSPVPNAFASRATIFSHFTKKPSLNLWKFPLRPA